MWLVLIYIYVALIIVLACVSYVLMFRPHIRSLEFTRQHALEHGDADAAFFGLDWKAWAFDSPQGYTLKGQYLRGKSGAPAALFVHGITWTRYGMIKYMRPFIEEGWSVAAFDLAGHGESVAPRRYYPSFGYYEKLDIAEGVKALHSIFPDASCYGLFGESLGAASVLEYAPLAGPPGARAIDFIVADCAFSSAWEELADQHRMIHAPNFIAWPAAQLMRLIVRVLRGFDMKDASPMKAVMQTDLPILFAHGMEDRYVPTIMSVRMASARLTKKLGQTDLVLIPGAGHAKGIVTDKARWLAGVMPFIDRVRRDKAAARDPEEKGD